MKISNFVFNNKHEIINDELIADWELAIKGENIFKIDPLK
jgi:hypothetical protein